MALPSLINGAECGPVNPLQSLSKQFDKDRGIQSDHFGPGRAGSQDVFRTTPSASNGLNQEATRFFSSQVAPPSFVPQHPGLNRFDLSSLGASLPAPWPSARDSLQSSSWAGDFLGKALHSDGHRPLQTEIVHSTRNPQPSSGQQYVLRTNDSLINSSFHVPVHHMAGYPQITQRPARLQSRGEDTISPEHFPPETQEEQTRSHLESVDADELARTAGLLIDAVKDETNPKFKNSVFLGLMRQLRDREAVIEGTQIIQAETQVDNGSLLAQELSSKIDVKGKGKEIVAENGWADAFQSLLQSSLTAQTRSDPRRFGGPEGSMLSAAAFRKSVHFAQSEATLEDPRTARQEDDDDLFWRQENADYQKYWNALPQPQERYFSPEWDQLQSDWDHFEATSSGIKPVTVYSFQQNNPYLTGTFSTRTHRLHFQENSSHESILELEATVQRDMQNPVRWYQLGVKQQENEREQSAILAIRRAVELDPSYLEAWLALAISHTNEGDKLSANNAIEQWIYHNQRYNGEKLLRMLGQRKEQTGADRNQDLTGILMNLVRQAPDREIDADIQTALGVLLNTNEEYEKAQDCFRAALSVRPNDWLLYNRVGATLANSGRASDAVWYYDQALALNPSYIRARFNLGISCVNMKRFDEAAHHILDALVLQENDAMHGTDARGITSSALWECLRTTCMQLQRPELAVLCDSRDLEAFRKAFLNG